LYIQKNEQAVPAVLLAAGMGSRLAPLTHTIPKCLVPIMGLPLLDFWIEMCVRANMSPIIINTAYLAQKVEEYVKTSTWKDMLILSHEKELLGTGGTLLAQKNVLKKGTFFVAHADNLSFFDMEKFYTAHKTRPKHCILTAMLFKTPTPQSCGIVQLDEHGVIQAFHEKTANPHGNLANGAVYFMEPETLDILENTKKNCPDISLDLLPHCIGRMNTFYNNEYHRDIGTLKSYAQAQEDMKARFPRHPHPQPQKDNEMDKNTYA